MNEKSNKTAVDWLIEKMLDSGIGICKEWREQAKEMEKQQIIDAFYQCGRDNFEHIKVINRSATDYYNETYGSKGIDEHIVDINEMISSQTEISDEEIEKGAKSKYPYNVFKDDDIKGMIISAQRGAWVDAIKWYREQLKQRQ